MKLYISYVYTNAKGEQWVGNGFVEQETAFRITENSILSLQTSIEKEIREKPGYKNIAEGSVGILNIIKLDEEPT